MNNKGQGWNSIFFHPTTTKFRSGFQNRTLISIGFAAFLIASVCLVDTWLREISQSNRAFFTLLFTRLITGEELTRKKMKAASELTSISFLESLHCCLWIKHGLLHVCYLHPPPPWFTFQMSKVYVTRQITKVLCPLLFTLYYKQGQIYLHPFFYHTLVLTFCKGGLCRVELAFSP